MKAIPMDCSWIDYDNDGDVDLFVANIFNQSDFLYTNNGDGSFTKISAGIVVNDAGYSHGCS
ncbi:VCBS repeat-containing protein [candidate division KSB1 bacterium]|nr:VCBS repeat-containing protein [candidate division KSB1 bacterium]